MSSADLPMKLRREEGKLFVSEEQVKFDTEGEVRNIVHAIIHSTNTNLSKISFLQQWNSFNAIISIEELVLSNRIVCFCSIVE